MTQIAESRQSTSSLSRLGSVLICFLASYLACALGAAASVSAGDFYAQLMRPTWAPPAWLFGPVWLLLYTMMALAATLVWLQRGFSQAKIALSLFFVHLIPNALWSFMFFAWQLGVGSLLNIAILWLAILSLIFLFASKHKIAAIIMLPYFLWVSFAAILNFRLWQLNPELL